MKRNKKNVREETLTILNMFGELYRSYAALNTKERHAVDLMLDGHSCFGFDGFSRQDIDHANFALDLAQFGKLDSFGPIKDWARLPAKAARSVHIYRRMLRAYHEILKDNNLSSRNSLTAQQINGVVLSSFGAGGRTIN